MKPIITLNPHHYFECLIEHYYFLDITIKYPRMVTRNVGTSCIFYTNKCTIHHVKPILCKIAPFSNSILNDSRVKRYFIKNCSAFSKLKNTIESLAYIELEKEYDYFMAINQSGFDSVFQINGDFKWDFKSTHMNCKSDAMYSKQNILDFGNISKYCDKLINNITCECRQTLNIE